MRTAVLVLSALLLSGCYESNSLLLDTSQARQPLTAAKDWTTSNAEGKVHASATPRSDGWYDYTEANVSPKGKEGAKRRHAVLLNFLTNANGKDIFVYGTKHTSGAGYFYGVVVLSPDNTWKTVTPSCDPVRADQTWYKPDIAAAKKAGASVKSAVEKADACVFTSREALFQAMRNVVASTGFWDRVASAQR